MPFISCPIFFRNIHAEDFFFKLIVKCSQALTHIGHEFCVITGKFFGRGLFVGLWFAGVFFVLVVLFFFFLKMANAFKQRKPCGHQIFIDPRNFHCKSNDIDTLHFRKQIKINLLCCLNTIRIATLSLNWRCYRKDSYKKSLCSKHKTCNLMYDNHRLFVMLKHTLKFAKYHLCFQVLKIWGDLKMVECFRLVGFFSCLCRHTTRESSDTLYLFILVRSARFLPVLHHNSSVSKSPLLFHWSERRKRRIIEVFCTKVCLGHHRTRTSTRKLIHSS